MSAASVSRQTGVSLLVVLVLLLIVTLLGLAALRGTVLEERMAANMLDRGLSFQATEGALREAESRIAQGITVPSSECNDGVCATPNPTVADRWLDTSSGIWKTSSVSIDSRTTQPKYIIEYMGEAPTWSGCDRLVPMPPLCLAPTYRITAISVGQGRAQVLLQTNFIKQ